MQQDEPFLEATVGKRWSQESDSSPLCSLPRVFGRS